MKYRLVTLVLAGMSLVGCTQSAVVNEEIVDAEFVAYQCDSKHSFEVAFLTEQKAAILRLPKHDYRMIQIPSGSGNKYILDDGTTEALNPMSLFTKGDNARLDLGRVIYSNCQVK